MEWLPKAASTVLTYGYLGYFNGSGYIIDADSTSGDHVGIIMRAVAATDSDYATTGAKIPVDFLSPGDVVEADVTGTLTVAMVGNMYDLSNGGTVNVGAQSKNVVTCVGFISATKGLFKVNSMIANLRVATT